MTHDYSDRPFAAGSLTGIRAYRVTEDGHLAGIHFRQLVTPGENPAVCHNRATQLLEAALVALDAEPGSEYEPHRMVELKCTCGFYGFFDGSSDYMRALTDGSGDPRVEAIVECYGACVVGSRGFRAEKLRLVAIIRNDPRPKPAERTRDVVGRWLSYHPRASFTIRSLAYAGALAGAVMSFTGTFYRWYALEVGLLILAESVRRLTRHGWRMRMRMQDKLADFFGQPRVPTEEQWQLISAAYPDVPIYTSRKAALAEHPLTVPTDAP